MVWLESPYVAEETLSTVLREIESRTDRSELELDKFFGKLNFDLGIARAVQNLESF
jgi:hypothetical protein